MVDLERLQLPSSSAVSLFVVKHIENKISKYQVVQFQEFIIMVKMIFKRRPLSATEISALPMNFK